MKKVFYIAFLSVVTLFMSSCGDPMGSKDPDVNLLYGKWQEGSVYERYDETGLGATWDVDDDIGEEEAQLFKWTLEGSTLIHEHLGTFVTVPKVYTITTGIGRKDNRHYLGFPCRVGVDCCRYCRGHVHFLWPVDQDGQEICSTLHQL